MDFEARSPLPLSSWVAGIIYQFPSCQCLYHEFGFHGGRQPDLRIISSVSPHPSLRILLRKIYQPCLHCIVCFFLLPSLSLSHLVLLPTSHLSLHRSCTEKVENAYKFSYSLASESMDQLSLTWKLSNQICFGCLLILFFQTKYWLFSYLPFPTFIQREQFLGEREKHGRKEKCV